MKEALTAGGVETTELMSKSRPGKMMIVAALQEREEKRITVRRPSPVSFDRQTLQTSRESPALLMILINIYYCVAEVLMTDRDWTINTRRRDILLFLPLLLSDGLESFFRSSNRPDWSYTSGGWRVRWGGVGGGVQNAWTRLHFSWVVGQWAKHPFLERQQLLDEAGCNLHRCKYLQIGGQAVIVPKR